MQKEDLRFYNPWKSVDQSENKLPHWEQPGATYFVTWRTADSLPQHFLEQQQRDKDFFLSQHPKPWETEIQEEYNQKFTAKLEEYLDSGHGKCLLRKELYREVLKDALLYFDQERYSMISFVIMPNHIHLLFTIHPDWSLSELIHSWKLHSSRNINKLNGSKGAFWQKDYFDRMIRDQKHFGRCIRYIRKNPQKARLAEAQYFLHESELASIV